jgi:hypothetical protein
MHLNLTFYVHCPSFLLLTEDSAVFMNVKQIRFPRRSSDTLYKYDEISYFETHLVTEYDIPR